MNMSTRPLSSKPDLAVPFSSALIGYFSACKYYNVQKGWWYLEGVRLLGCYSITFVNYYYILLMTRWKMETTKICVE